MIALLDPSLFARASWPAGRLSHTHENELIDDLTGILDLCRKKKATIAADHDSWRCLWLEIIGPLQKRLPTSRASTLLAELRKLGQTRPSPAAPTGVVRLWGFNLMFGALPSPAQGPGWPARLAALAATLVADGHEIILLTYLQDGRNLKIHRGKTHSTILEVTRWRVTVRLPRTPQGAHIPCVRSLGQLHRPWTTRYDERLPTDRDGARYPFCLPVGETWQRSDVPSVRTVQSVPCWVDRAGRGWARPNIPGAAGYHWDVYLAKPDIALIGVTQLNIVEQGAPAPEGAGGSIHHIPGELEDQVQDRGWACP